MKSLSIPRMGFGIGGASAVLYLGCVFVMATVEHETAIRFFNSIMHGVDVAPIMRWDMPWWEAGIGLVETFILGWFFGAIVACFYNLSIRIVP